MAVTLPSSSRQLKARYWGRGSIVGAGDVDTDSGGEGFLQECNFVYANSVGGFITGGGLDDSAAFDSEASEVYTSLTSVTMTIGVNVERVAVYVDGKDITFKLETSLGDSDDGGQEGAQTISGAGQGTATYDRGAGGAEAQIQVNLAFKWRGTDTPGNVYRWVIYEPPMTVGELP